MSQISTAPETRARIIALAEGLGAEQKAMLMLWLDHWWAEVVYDIETCTRTLSPDVVYRSYGANIFGDVAVEGAADARAMYQGLFDAGLMPGGPFDEEKFSFASWGLMMDAVFTSIFPGRMMVAYADFDPDQLYKIRWRMAVSHPIDLGKGQIRGEIMYPGAPFSIEPSDRAEVARLLGR